MTTLVRRFAGWTVVFHWSHALPYLVAAGSAAASLVTKAAAARTLHRGAGIAVSTLPLFVLLVGDRRAVLGDIALAIGGFGRRRPVRGSGYNLGQRINTQLALAFWLLLSVSGWLVLWSPSALGVRAAHALFGAFSALLVLGHLGMALLHPRSLRAITTGSMRREEP